MEDVKFPLGIESPNSKIPHRRTERTKKLFHPCN